MTINIVTIELIHQSENSGVAKEQKLIYENFAFCLFFENVKMRPFKPLIIKPVLPDVCCIKLIKEIAQKQLTPDKHINVITLSQNILFCTH